MTRFLPPTLATAAALLLGATLAGPALATSSDVPPVKKHTTHHHTASHKAKPKVTPAATPATPAASPAPAGNPAS